MKNTRKYRFLKKFFSKKPMKPNFFRNFCRRKCSLGSGAILSEKMVSASVLGFEKFASLVSKLDMSRILRKKVTIWAPRQARAPKKPGIFYVMHIS